MLLSNKFKARKRATLYNGFINSFKRFCMNDNSLSVIIERLDRLEQRLAKIEGSAPKPSPSTHVPSPIPQRTTSVTTAGPKKESHFLGYVGAACIILASILLIKLSIDSGWLTPLRQIIIATIFAVGLVSIPFLTKLRDVSYTGLLPAMGVTILHLTTYGAVFYHHLLAPSLGILLISLIGLLSLWLLFMMEQETYAVLAIVGTYLGALFFHQSFTHLMQVAVYILVWDIVFSLFAIRLQRRLIIAVSSYLALGLVALIGLDKGFAHADFNIKVLVVQSLQFIIFTLATIFYSIHNRAKLTENESWSFFPIIVFFYGQQYFFLDRLSQNGATAFALLFALFLFAIYSYAKNRMEEKELASSGIVFTTISIILAHSLYIVVMNDIARLIFTLVVAILLGIFREKIVENKGMKGSLIVFGVIVFFSYLGITVGEMKIGHELFLLFGTLYGFLFLYFSQAIKTDLSVLILSLGHIQILLALYRLKQYIGHFAIAPLWIAYSFVILVWANKTNDRTMAKGAVPMVVIGLGRFLFFDFAKLSGSQQILSLFIMGALIFAGGYLYRRAVKA